MPPATPARGATATAATRSPSTRPTPEDLLARGTLSLEGRLPWASNATFLVACALDGVTARAVYKPERGERPLWDFPRGLHKREVAAYRLSEALGWGLVPLTLPREGPFGVGSLQLFIEADFAQHYFTLREDARHRGRLERICLFDLMANNADRKGGHCLLGTDGEIYAVDNGLTFHTDPKLRTVIWDFGGEPVPAPLLADVRRLVESGLPHALAELLAPPERKALLARAGRLLRAARFPADETGHRYPWPLV
jgi:uncharacterized repeat protein (TIGR03843 family)